MGMLLKQLKFLGLTLFKYRRSKIFISPLSYCDSSCNFKNRVYIDRFSVLHNVEINSYSYVGDYTTINNCTIGKFCSIGSNVRIGPGLHPTNRISTSPVFHSNSNCLGTKWVTCSRFQEELYTNIGNDVWIGSNAVVMSGIKIGNGVIVAAGAVVTRDIEPYAIVGGVPAKLIRRRLSEENILKLDKIQWWNWEEEALSSRVIDFENPDLFIEKYGDIKS